MKSPGFQLSLQTSSLVVGFMVWVIISSLMPSIKADIGLTAGEVSIITAIPVILGSLLRIPIGYYTDRFGARIIFMISFIVLLFPVYFISVADSFSDLVIGGLFLGVGGAIFSVGVTSLPKYYPKEKHGFINGIYGVGNIGTAVTTFGAPILATQFGWEKTVQIYLILLLVFAGLNFIFGDRKEKKANTPLIEQMKGVYKNSTLWFLSLFYFITFGAFVAFTMFLPNFLVTTYQLTSVDAGMRTAGFIILATAMRPVGGFLADKFNSFIILMFTFIGVAISGILLSFSPNLTWYTVGALAVAISVGIGNGTVFKLVPLYFSKQAGIVNGIVSAMGGLGGFFPPLLLTAVFNITGHYAIAFMALSQIALVCFVIVFWMYYEEHLSMKQMIIENTIEGIMVTDKDGIIQSINPAFTKVTGYRKDEVIGLTANILHSGKQDKLFYQKMWDSINENGSWEGEIWNKRKNGDIYPEWLSISVIRGKSGDIRGYVGMFNDISKKHI